MRQTVTSNDIIEMVRDAGLRPTRQRLSLARQLFTGEDRHVTGEQVHSESLGQGVSVSLRHRLQHVAPIHRRRTAARTGCRCRALLFRHQYQRPSSSLFRRYWNAARRLRRQCRHRRVARTSRGCGDLADRRYYPREERRDVRIAPPPAEPSDAIFFHLPIRPGTGMRNCF